MEIHPASGTQPRLGCISTGSQLESGVPIAILGSERHPAGCGASTATKRNPTSPALHTKQKENGGQVEGLKPTRSGGSR
jgi:hypothetical protein